MTTRYTLDDLTGRPPRTWAVVMALVGLMAIAVASVLPILNVSLEPGTVGVWWKYLYVGGAVLFLVAKLCSPYKGKHIRIRGLYRVESWSAIFFCVAAFFLFYNGAMTRDSWAFTLAGAALLAFTTIAIPRTVKKILSRQDSDGADGSKTKKSKK